MIEQKVAPKSFKATVSHGDTSASIQTANTSVYDLSLVAILVIGFTFSLYLVKRGKRQ